MALVVLIRSSMVRWRHECFIAQRKAILQSICICEVIFKVTEFIVRVPNIDDHFVVLVHYADWSTHLLPGRRLVLVTYPKLLE